jgi:hypothetical protein
MCRRKRRLVMLVKSAGRNAEYQVQFAELTGMG